MSDYLTILLKVVISIAIAIIVRYVVPYIKTITESEKQSALMEVITVAVKAAEQTIRESGQGKVKKAQVVAFVSSWMQEHRINITEDELDRLIEFAVMNMKIELSGDK